MLLEILLALFAILIAFGFLGQRKPKGYPPGPLSLPIIGNLHQLTTHPFIKFMEMRKTYGDIFAIDFGSIRGVIINDPKLIREALNMAEFSGRPKLKVILDTCGGKLRGVIFGEGHTWLEHRRFALRNLRDFGFGKLSMGALIQEEIEGLLKTLTKLQGQVFETKHVFNVAVVSSLWRIISGESFEHDDQKLKTIVEMFVSGVADTPAAPIAYFFPWVSVIAPELSGYNTVVGFQVASVEFITQAYREQKETFKLGEARHFIDIYTQKMMETTDPTSAFYGEEGEKNLIKTLADLFMAGIETTSSTLSWAFMFLVVHQEIQEKLYQEIKAVVGLSRPPSLDDEKSLPYTQAIMNEVLRYSSLVPFSVFHSTTEDVEFHGYKIPKDTMIMPNLYGVHHDPAIWGDPEAFRPERFIAEDGTFMKHPDQPVMPFSTGKRVCLGESLARSQLFLFIANIFQHFKVEGNPAKPPPVIAYIPSALLQPKSYEYILIPRVN